MNHKNRAAGAASAVLAAVLLSACGPNDAVPVDSPSTSSDPSSVTPSPSASPSPSEAPTDSASAQAENVIVEYWAMLDKLASEPDTSLSDLTAVARGSARKQWQQILTRQRGQQYTQTGNVLVESAKAKSSTAGAWDVTACLDTTKVNVVDKDGKSVRGDGPQRVEYVYGVQRDGGRFYVVEEKVVGEC